MKRLFFQSKLYDYSNKQEAAKHIKEMEQRKWHAKRQDNGEFIFTNNQDELPFSVEFFKEI